MTAKLDVVVLGADANGLAAAHYLTRAGRRVLVLERATAPNARLDVGWVPDAVIRDLELERHGLKIERPEPWITSGTLTLPRDVTAAADAIGRVSPADAAKWPEFCARMRRLAGVLERLYVQPPPDVETREIGELLRLAGLGLYVKRLGKQTIIDLARVLPMSIAELLDDWFESDALKGMLGALGVWHLRQGPRSGGTAFNFLHHHAGSPEGVFRPARSNATQVLAAMPGVEIRAGAAAVVTAARGRVTGVAVAGEHIAAPLVVSSLSPQATFGPPALAAQLDPEFVRAVRNIRARPCVVRGRWAGNGSVGPTCVAPSLEYLERAYDDAKYGRVSAKPLVEAIGTELHVQYAATADSGLPSRVAAALGAATDQIHLDASDDHPYHGDMTLDQILFMRPVAGWSRYRTPVAGLYLCGAGTHPGGGIVGAAGRNAARVILKES